MKNPISILLYIILCSSFFSCSVTKKDNAAVNRVKANVTLLNKACNPSWKDLNPCKIDSSVEYIYGGRVTVIDTLNTVDTVTVDNIKYVYKTIEKNVNQVDTSKTVKSDGRELKLLYDELNKSNLDNSNKDGQISQLKDSNSKQSKDNGKLRLWIIGISIFSVVVIIGLCYLLFKK